MSVEVQTPKTASIIERVKNILLTPKTEWEKIDAEPATVKGLFMGYAIWLAAIGPVCTVIGSLVFGRCVWFVCYRPPIISTIVTAIVAYLASLAAAFILGLIIDMFAATFGAQKNREQAMKVAVYASTAWWVGGVFSILPQLAVLGFLVALYGLYILWLGLPKLMKAPEDKATAYVVVAVIVSIIADIVAFSIAGAVGGMAMFGGAMAANPMASANMGGGAYTFHGKNGTATVNLGALAAMSKQAQAQANAAQNGGAAVTPVAADVLASMLPASVNGMAKGDTSSASGSAMGMATGNAKASYSGGGSSITLEVTDSGSMSSVMGMTGALGVNSEEHNGTHYSKTSTVDGQVNNEEYDTASKSGSFSEMVAGRFLVEAHGNNVSMDQLKAAVNSVDKGKLASMKGH